MTTVKSKLSALRRAFLRGVIDMGVFSGIINVLLLVSPLYMLQVYDRVLPSSSLDTLLHLSIIAVAALAFLGLLEVVRSFYAQRIAANLDKHLAALAFSTALTGPRAEAGDIQPLRDLATVRGFVASKGLTTLFDLPFAPFFITLLYFVHPVLFWITVAGAALMIALVILNQFANRGGSLAAMERSAAANLSAQAFVRNGDTLRAMGMSGNATQVWGGLFADASNTADRSANLNAVFAGISRAVRMMLQMAILGVGAILVLKGEMTAGMIFASSIISGRALQPLDQLVGMWKQLGDARKAWARTTKVIAIASTRSGDKLQLPEPTGKISVRDLVYTAPGAAPGSEPILKRLNLDIAAGESVAIIGPSRAGKSTLARLLVNAAEPTAGSVKLDGADLKTWDEVQLGRATGYLAQDVQLLPGTITENVSRFDPDGSDAAVIEAAMKAQVHDLILSQPMGYQTRIGPSGANLSGGERQRIGLARAFYGNPKLLVLDEPNANLDSDGEAALERALRQAKDDGATVIIISHRMSIATLCDKVLVLRSGMIEAFGPPGEVLRKAQPPQKTSAFPVMQGGQGNKETHPSLSKMLTALNGKQAKDGA